MPRLPASLLAALILTCPTAAQGVKASRPAASLPVVPGSRDTAKGNLFELEMLADGTLRQAGKVLTTADLRAKLTNFAKQHPGRKVGPITLSKGLLLARLHRDLPYEALYRLVEMCARPEIAIVRIDVAVRAAKRGAERVVPITIPVDEGVNLRAATVPAKIRFAGAPMTGESLRLAMRKVAPIADKRFGDAKPPMILEPESHVSIESVLRVVQAARLAGIKRVHCSVGRIQYRGWVGDHDFGKLVRAMEKRPARAPGLTIGPPRRESVEEEIVKEEEVEEEEVEEEVVPETRPKAVNTALVRTGGKYGNRGTAPRGADVPAKVAIDLALQWLVRHQDADGRWDADGFMKHDRERKPTDGKGKEVHDVGVTGLALLAFLGDGNTLRSGPHKDVVKRAVKWLRSQQGDDGLLGARASHDFIYDHAIATVALCEAYGLSQYRLLKKNAQKAIDYLEAHRNPHGIWRYQPRDNDNDISVSSWCLLAYRSASDFELKVNRQALVIGAKFIDRLTDPKTGRCGYTRRGEPSARKAGGHATRFPVDKGEALTGAALFVRFMLGQKPKEVPVMMTAANTILSKPPKWQDDGSIDFYYWYYGTYAMYQMGGTHWTRWHKALTPAVLKHQRKDGNFAGSWDPVGVWSEDGGRVYSTAMCALTLQAFYRYARLVR